MQKLLRRITKIVEKQRKILYISWSDNPEFIDTFKLFLLVRKCESSDISLAVCGLVQLSDDRDRYALTCENVVCGSA